MAHEATIEFFMIDDNKGNREMLFGPGKDAVSVKDHTKEFIMIFKKFPRGFIDVCTGKMFTQPFVKITITCL